MTLPTVFATYPAGNVAASLLDANFTFLEAQGVQALTTTGLVNAYILTPTDPWLTTYANYIGRALTIIPSITNTSATTVNVSGLGAVNLRKNTGGVSTVLAAGDLVAGVPAVIVCDGSIFWLTNPTPTVGGTPFQHSQVITSTTTFTPATGVSVVYVEVWGGGGGGGGASNGSASNYAAGGGGGGYTAGFVTVTPGVAHAATVGVGGTAGSSAGSDGGTGGTSSFAGTSLTPQATGGGGGGGTTVGANVIGGAGGVGSIGTLNLTGQHGFGANTTLNMVLGNGGSAPRGGGGGVFSSAIGTTIPGSNGISPGGGAGGAVRASGAGSAGGVGADGMIVVYYP